MTAEAPRIITFYSYKGGTGRTMALANAAWILASNGRRVLMIDWDLEAPGLHRYFHPFLTDKTLAATKGVIDMVYEYQRMVLEIPNVESIRELPDTWYDEHTDVFRYITEFDWTSQPGFGELHLLCAGQQTIEYGARVNTFNWRQLFEKLGGYRFFEAIKRQLVASGEYDYVLIDSRTGVSDTSGVCTVQMPDALVVCFTLNSQSIDGASEVALGVREQRGGDLAAAGAGGVGGAPILIFPLPTRVEKAEKQKLDLARQAARSRFDTFVAHLEPDARERYWGAVEVFYEPFYAYEEVLATVADHPGSITSLLASMERLVSYVINREIRMPPVRDSLRRQVLEAYERRRTDADDPLARANTVLQRLSLADGETAQMILLRVTEPGVGGSVLRRTVSTTDIAAPDVVNRLVDEGLLSRKLGDEDTEFVTLADERLLEWPTLQGWVQDRAEALRMRPMLEHLAARWQQENRPPELLLPPALADWAQQAASEARLFDRGVAPFVSASVRRGDELRRQQNERDTQRRRTRRLVQVVAVAAAAAVTALGVSWIVPHTEWWETRRVLSAVRTKMNPIDGLQYVWIPEGEFQMGCAWATDRLDAGCNTSLVQIKNGFWMGQTEVTNAAYERSLKARNRPTTTPLGLGSPAFPVAGVDFLDALDYCSWAGGRLPNSMEWEYAARGGKRSTRYITGDTLDDSRIAVGTQPKPVGSFVPNGFGLFDMSGNVAEWVIPADTFGRRTVSVYPNDPDQAMLNELAYPFPVSPTRGGSYLPVLRDLQLHVDTQQRWDAHEPTIGMRCMIPGSELEQVAASYRINPFTNMYFNVEQNFSPYVRSLYRSWLYSVYMKQRQAEQFERRTP